MSEFSDEALQRYPFAEITPPVNWSRVALEEISADVSPGFASGKHNSDGTGVPHLRPMNVDRDGQIDLNVVKSVAESNGIELRSGDVLFNNTNSAELVGKTAAVSARETGFAFSNHMTRIRPESGVCTVFAARQLHFLWMTGYLKHRCTNHVNQASISSKTLAKTIPFLLPPRAEQARIVAKLEELLSDLDAGVAELKAARKKLAQYRQSLLKAAVEGALTAEWRAKRQTTLEPSFPRRRESSPEHHNPLDSRLRGNDEQETGAQLLARILTERRARWEAKQLAKFKEQGKPVPRDWQKKYPEPVQPDIADLPELPEGWVWASVDQLSESVRNGLSKTPNTNQRGFPIFKINAVRPMSVNFDAIKHIEIDESEAANYWVEVGDVLATRYNGSVDLLGVFGMVKDVPVRTLHPDKIIRMKPVTGAQLGAWMEVCGNVGLSRRHLVSRVKTTAGQTGISGDDLKKTPIPLPPTAEQEIALAVVVERLHAATELELPIEFGLKQSTAQRQNLLRAAFSGRLVPQDPNDEPASVLLARIRAERAARNAGKMPRGRRQLHKD